MSVPASTTAFLSVLGVQSIGGSVAIGKTRRKTVRHSNPAIGHGTRCAYCGDEHAPVTDHLVPVGQGGPNIGQNLRPSCSSCNTLKGNADWLLFGKAIDPKDIKAARLAMLALVPNHLIRDPRSAWKRDDVCRSLNRRWQVPRCAMFASCCDDYGYVGWPIEGTRTIGKDIRAAIVASGAVRVADGLAVAFRVPREKFLELVWDLIDRNAWVRRLDIPGHPDATLRDDPELARWSETYRNVGEIVLRRPYVPRIDGRYPHRPEGVSAPKSYPTKPPALGEVRKPRIRRGEGRNARAAQRKVAEALEWLKRKPAPRFYEPGPHERAYLGGLTPEREWLLDRAWRRLAYEVAGREMPVRRKPRKVRADNTYFRGRRGRAERVAKRQAEDRAWEHSNGKPQGWLDD